MKVQLNIINKTSLKPAGSIALKGVSGCRIFILNK
jgi:hypothetical protein